MKNCLSLLVLLQAACLPQETTSFVAALTSQRPAWSKRKLLSSLQYIDDTNYANVLSSREFVLVDACATWCGPCKVRIRGSFLCDGASASAKRVLGGGSFEIVIVDGEMSFFPIACMIHFQVVVC